MSLNVGKRDVAWFSQELAEEFDVDPDEPQLAEAAERLLSLAFKKAEDKLKASAERAAKKQQYIVAGGDPTIDRYVAFGPYGTTGEAASKAASFGGINVENPNLKHYIFPLYQGTPSEWKTEVRAADKEAERMSSNPRERLLAAQRQWHKDNPGEVTLPPGLDKTALDVWDGRGQQDRA